MHMEVTMQWWDDADDLYYAALLRLESLSHLAPHVMRAGLCLAAGALLI